MTQSELAWRIQVACTNISAIECGRVEAWPKIRKAISKVFDTPEKEIFPESNNDGETSR